MILIQNHDNVKLSIFLPSNLPCIFIFLDFFHFKTWISALIHHPKWINDRMVNFILFIENKANQYSSLSLSLHITSQPPSIFFSSCLIGYYLPNKEQFYSVVVDAMAPFLEELKYRCCLHTHWQLCNHSIY